MKIRKIYMALCGILFAARPISAQQTMLVVGNNGSVNAVAVSSVSYATFNASDKWFTFSNDGIKILTKNLITADCTVKLAADSEVKSLSVTPEVGVCYSKNNAVPTIEDNCLSLGSELKTYTFTLKSLISGTTYYFRPYVKLANAVFYGDLANAKTLTASMGNSKIISGHKFIDLGLPSGLLWAETNIGAETAADDGNYYAWGETDTKRGDYFDSNYTTYSSSGKTTLEKQHDAAYVNWGSFCRMPTRAEFKELRNSSNCTWTWTSMTASNGSSHNGYQVTSVKNGNSIFLPASGDDTGLSHGSYGYYWSSTLSEVSSFACILYFYSRNYSYKYCEERRECLTVRPVAEP